MSFNLHIDDARTYEQAESERLQAEERDQVEAGSKVYFAISIDDNRIKIGNSRDPLRRLGHLQTGSGGELRLLAMFPGGLEKERELHKMFADLRVRGEWFQSHDDILSFIANLPDGANEIGQDGGQS